MTKCWKYSGESPAVWFLSFLHFMFFVMPDKNKFIKEDDFSKMLTVEHYKNY